MVNSDFKNLFAFDGKNWFDFTPTEENIEDELSPFEYEKTGIIFLNRITFAFYGIISYDKKIEYKKIPLPEGNLIDVTFSPGKIYYLVFVNEQTEIKEIEISNLENFNKISYFQKKKKKI